MPAKQSKPLTPKQLQAQVKQKVRLLNKQLSEMAERGIDAGLSLKESDGRRTLVYTLELEE
jgi:hypothetical protein